MASSKSGQNPEILWCDDGGRPYVKPYNQINKFRVGDKVYLLKSSGGSREGGPYVIASIPSGGTYTLSLENGQAVKNGEEIKEEKLEAA